MDLPYIFAGFLVGVIVGLTGIGGGSLMTPILVLSFSVPPVTAVGTDLVHAAITKSTGVWVHGQRGTVRWQVVATMALGSLPAAIATVLLLGQIDAHSQARDVLITTTLSIALILTSLVLLFRGRLQRVHENPRLAPLRAVVRRWRVLLTTLGGAVIGVLLSLSSVGAGALGTALLVLLYPGLRGAAIVGTDLAHAVPLAAVAGIGHMHLGSVDLGLLGNLLLGSLPGVYLGSRLGVFLPDTVLRSVLAAMLMFVGLRLAM